MITDVIVERRTDNARSALRIPYAVRDGAIIIDFMDAMGAVEMLRQADKMGKR